MRMTQPSPYGVNLNGSDRIRSDQLQVNALDLIAEWCRKKGLNVNPKRIPLQCSQEDEIGANSESLLYFGKRLSTQGKSNASGLLKMKD